MNALALVLTLASASFQEYAPPAPTGSEVRLWLDTEAAYERGDRARVHVRAERDGYLLVLHADPRGVVRVLFPIDPGVDDFVRGGEVLEVLGRGGRDAFLVEERSGSGVVLAAWSREPFRFGGFVRGDHWDYRAIAPDGVGGDVEAGLLDVAYAMADGARFDYDVQHYVVGETAYRDRGYSTHTVVYARPYGVGIHRTHAHRSGFHLSLNLGIFAGDPYFGFGVHYDPFFPFGRGVWYAPVYHYDPYWGHRPHRRVWVYDPIIWVPVPRYRHGGIGIHYRYASGCRWDPYCGRYPRTGYATGVSTRRAVPRSGWGVGDGGFGTRVGWGIADAGRGTFDDGRRGIGIGTRWLDDDGAGTRIGGAVGPSGGLDSRGSSIGRAVPRTIGIGSGAAAPRSQGGGISGVVIGTRDRTPGRIGNDGGAAEATRRAQPPTRTTDRIGSDRPAESTRRAQPSTRTTGRIGSGGDRPADTARRTQPTTRRAEPAPRTTGRIGSGDDRRADTARRTQPTTRRAEPAPRTTGRIGGSDRASPTTRAAQPRSGATRSAPTIRSRSGGDATGKATSRGSSSKRGGRIGGNV